MGYEVVKVLCLLKIKKTCCMHAERFKKYTLLQIMYPFTRSMLVYVNITPGKEAIVEGNNTR